MSFVIENAHEHNLKNLSLSIPRFQLVAVTGPSGSGKTSLIFDTLAAEAAWRFAMFESNMPFWAGMRAERKRPAVDSILGLSFTAAIPAQQYVSRFETLATVAGIFEPLREFFYLSGYPRCLQCGLKLQAQRPTEIVADIMRQEGKLVQVFAPLSGEKLGGEGANVAHLLKSGFTRLRLDGELRRLENVSNEELQQAATVAILVDVLAINEQVHMRVAEAVGLALQLNPNELQTWIEESTDARTYTTVLRCSDCQLEQRLLRLENFSYYTQAGACPACGGTGQAESVSSRIRLPKPCEACSGTRLRAEARERGFAETTFGKVFSGTVEAALQWCREQREHEERSAKAFAALKTRLETLRKLGLEYLQLNRGLQQLSAGEIQRVLLARSLASRMSGILYLLDEPSSGLHPRDVGKVIGILQELVAQGNTVVAVEHDPQLIAQATEEIEMGPGAGARGGEIVYQGPPRKEQISTSLRAVNAEPAKQFLELRGVTANNLRNLDLRIPLNRLVAVCGVSGAGKSTLVSHCLVPNVRAMLQAQRRSPGSADVPLSGVREIFGCEALRSLVEFAQRPPSPQARSLVASVLGILPELRELYSKTVDARIAGLPPRAFSFLSQQGRCPHCRGRGFVEGGETEIVCPECRGVRLAKIPASIKLRGRTFAETLALTVEEFRSEFSVYPQLIGSMIPLAELGLQYLRLDQPLQTLSLGERQRLRMSAELREAFSGRQGSLFVFDEPTRGLHRREVERFLRLAQRLLDAGHSLIVVEHQLDVLRAADYLIELGPGAGEQGGQVIFSGTSSQSARASSLWKL